MPPLQAASGLCKERKFRTPRTYFIVYVLKPGWPACHDSGCLTGHPFLRPGAALSGGREPGQAAAASGRPGHVDGRTGAAGGAAAGEASSLAMMLIEANRSPLASAVARPLGGTRQS